MQTFKFFLLGLVVATWLCACGTDSNTVDPGQDKADNPFTFEIRLDRTSVTEGDAANISAVMSEPLSEPLTMLWEVVEPKGRFDADTGAFQIPRLFTRAAFVLTFPHDGLYQGDQTAKLRVWDETGKYKPVEFQLALVDADPMPFVSVTDTEAVRGSRLDLQVTLSQASARDTTIQWHTVDQTAKQGLDYIGGQGAILIAAGATKAIIGVTSLPTAADSSFGVQLTAADFARIADGSATGHIQGGDTLDTSVSFAIEQSTAQESDGQVNIALQLSRVVNRDVSVAVNVSGSATVNEDFTPITATIVIPAGQMSAMIPANLVDDTLFEHNETLVLELATASFASFGPITTHTLTIQDNDPFPTLSVYDAQALEGSPLTFSVVLSKVSGADTSFSFKTETGTAEGGDFKTTAGTLRIPRGNTVASVAVETYTDSLFEVKERISLLLSSAAGATLLRATGEGAITDDDTAPSVQFASASQNIPATQDKVQVVLSLSAVSGASITIPFSVSGTAEPGQDHNLAASVVTIPAGHSSGMIEFTIFHHYTTPRSVVIQLGAPTNASLGTKVQHTVLF